MNTKSLADQISTAPKQFCDSVNGGFSNEVFLIAMFSGQTASVFTFTPAHMKKFSQWANHQVLAYEKKYSVIKAEWTPNIPSPLQISDLEDGKEKN